MTERKKRILSCLLSFVLGVGIGIGGYRVTETIVRNSSVEIDQQLSADNGGMLVSEETEGNGIKLLSSVIDAVDVPLSEGAESAYDLYATVTPTYAVDAVLDWTIGFVDPESEWAAGKTVTDYVTVTPTSDGGLGATVTCYGAFSEQIYVKASVRTNAEIYAVCTVDYLKRITDFLLVFSCDESDFASLDMVSSGHHYNLTLNVTYTEGTVAADIICNKATMNLYDDYVQALLDIMKSTYHVDAYGAYADGTFCAEYSLMSYALPATGIENTLTTHTTSNWYQLFFRNWEYFDSGLEVLRSAIYTANSSWTSNEVYFTAEVYAEYNGIVLLDTTVSTTYNSQGGCIRIDTSKWSVTTAESVTLDQNEIVVVE